MTTTIDLLIVEDKPEEAQEARIQAQNAGYKTIEIVSDLSSALKVLPQATAVATDLFFPLGDAPSKPHVDRFLPNYKEREAYWNKEADSPVIRAIQMCANAFGITPQEYITQVIQGTASTPKIIKEAATDAVRIMERQKGATQNRERAERGEMLPLGIIVADAALHQGSRAVIVTSTYHHDDLFEAVRDQVKVPYVDRVDLATNKKQWTEGLQKLSTYRA